MWGGWGGPIRGWNGSQRDWDRAGAEGPRPEEQGAGLWMMRGAERRAYRILLVVAALVAVLMLRACSVTIESGMEGHYTHDEGAATETPTPGGWL
jgi:hypothetical protein